VHNIEVYKQSDGFATELKVRKYLGLMYRRDGLDRLDFDHHQVFHQQINAIAQFELYTAINDRETYLRGGMDSGTPQFKLKAGRVSAFQQAGAEFGMNLSCPQ
jgi:hypothetical protein